MDLPFEASYVLIIFAEVLIKLIKLVFHFTKEENHPPGYRFVLLLSVGPPVKQRGYSCEYCNPFSFCYYRMIFGGRCGRWHIWNGAERLKTISLFAVRDPPEKCQ